MGRSGNIGWGISNYFKLPNRKKKLLTKEFLMDFRNDLINMQNEYDNKNGNITDWDKDGSYYGFFGEVASTYMFYDSLLRVCKKHNLVSAIYNYAKKLPWYDSDTFDDDLVLEMVNKGVIPLKTGKEFEYDENYDISDFDCKKYKLVKHYKGYCCIEYDDWLGEKESLEEIYKDSDNVEIIWLD